MSDRLPMRIPLCACLGATVAGLVLPFLFVFVLDVAAHMAGASTRRRVTAYEPLRELETLILHHKPALSNSGPVAISFPRPHSRAGFIANAPWIRWSYVTMFIDNRGIPLDVQVDGIGDWNLEADLERTFRSWRFSPAIHNGLRVPSTMRFPLHLLWAQRHE